MILTELCNYGALSSCHQKSELVYMDEKNGAGSTIYCGPESLHKTSSLAQGVLLNSI